MHLPAADDLVLADDGDVVLRLAGDHAGVAADAGVQVDRHAPGGPFGLVILGVELRRDVARLVVLEALQLALRDVLVDADLLHEGRVGLEFFERRLADEAAPLHRIVLLGDGERIGPVDLLDFHPGDETGSGGGAERVGVEPGALGHPQRRGHVLLRLFGQARGGSGPSRGRGPASGRAGPARRGTGSSRLRPSGVVTRTIGKAVVGSTAMGELETRGEKSVFGQVGGAVVDRADVHAPASSPWRGSSRARCPR